MGKDKTGVVITVSMYEAIKPLPDNERLQLYDAVTTYGIEKKAPKLTGYLQSIFTLMKPNIDSSQNRYRATQENGSKGGAPKGNQNARKPKNNQTNNQTNNHDIDSDIDSDSNSDKDSDSNSNCVGVRAGPRQSASPPDASKREKGPTFLPEWAE